MRRTHGRYVDEHVAAGRVNQQRNVLTIVARTVAGRTHVERKVARICIDVHGRSARAAGGLRQNRIVAGGRVGGNGQFAREGAGLIDRDATLHERPGTVAQRNERAAASGSQDAPRTRPYEPCYTQHPSGMNDRGIGAYADDRSGNRGLRERAQKCIAVTPLCEREDGMGGSIPTYGALRIGLTRYEGRVDDELHPHPLQRGARSQIHTVEKRAARRLFGEQTDARAIDPHLLADVAAAGFDDEKAFARSQRNAHLARLKLITAGRREVERGDRAPVRGDDRARAEVRARGQHVGGIDRVHRKSDRCARVRIEPNGRGLPRYARICGKELEI